jgi:hypothetical protein
MTRPEKLRGRLVAGLSLALAALAAGCVQMPEQGAVHESDTSAGASVEQASSIDAVPPQPDAEPADIAKGFIDAMAAWPIQTGVAREFLSEEAAAAWKPDATITFTGFLLHEFRSGVLSVDLSGAEFLDAKGAWQGEVPEAEQELDFEMTIEDGEYRIKNPRDALVVPATWFAQRFRQVSLYFFDRTGRILVPEPVFVPRGDQLASTLTKRLLEGPGDELSGISRSYLPSGLDAGLSVPVTDDGVAQVQLGGSYAGPQNTDDVERMLAQLGWTLRQVPGIRALQVAIGGEEVRLPGGDAEYDVNQARQFDPAGADANPLLYGLRGGRLVYGEAESLAPAEGPLGDEEPEGLRSVSLSLDATEAVGVSSDGRSLLMAQVRGAERDDVVEISRHATDLLPPAWDFTGRLWIVDNTREGARVAFREPEKFRKRGKLVTLQVPGVSGRQVRAFLVSRDATRFVAVVRGPGGDDQVRAGRITVDDRGRIAGAGPTRRIRVEGVAPVRVRDIAWISPTSIVVLRPGSEERSEVGTVAVDGAPSVAEPLSTSVTGRDAALATSPDADSTPYAATREGLVDLDTGAIIPFADGRVTSIGYVG